MGGRLALHALLQRPDLWRCGILVSTHPGLKDAWERKQRYESDCRWADRFLSDPWELLMQDWEAQAIFNQASFRFERLEKDYSRDELAHHLLCFSLGLQEDLRKSIQKLAIPLLWVTGSKDNLYASLAHEITTLHLHSSHVSLPIASHRVPWEQKELFDELLNSYSKAPIA
jgi:2-succinyl-6-hydroxy-2,4-cyclohexadiene-1-carboxylate synthase